MSTPRTSRRKSKGSYGFRPANPNAWGGNTLGLGLSGRDDFERPAAMNGAVRSYSLGPVHPFPGHPTKAGALLPPRPRSSGAASIDYDRSEALASIARPGHFHRASATRTPYTSPLISPTNGVPPRPSSHSSSLASSTYLGTHDVHGDAQYDYNTDAFAGTAESISPIHSGSGYGTSDREYAMSSGYGRTSARSGTPSASMSSLNSGFSSLSRLTGTGSLSSLAGATHGSGYDRYSGDSASSGWSMAQQARHSPLNPRSYSRRPLPRPPGQRYNGIVSGRPRGSGYEDVDDHHDSVGGLSYALAGLSVSNHTPRPHGHGHGRSGRIVPSLGSHHYQHATYVVEPSEAGSDHEDGDYTFQSDHSQTRRSRHRHIHDNLYPHDSASGGLSDGAYTDEYEADYDYDEEDLMDPEDEGGVSAYPRQSARRHVHAHAHGAEDEDYYDEYSD